MQISVFGLKAWVPFSTELVSLSSLLGGIPDGNPDDGSSSLTFTLVKTVPSSSATVILVGIIVGVVVGAVVLAVVFGIIYIIRRRRKGTIADEPDDKSTKPPTANGALFSLRQHRMVYTQQKNSYNVIPSQQNVYSTNRAAHQERLRELKSQWVI
jgi:hypothetical protein